MRIKMRSRVHVVFLELVNSTSVVKVIKLIQLRNTPAFLYDLVDKEISADAENFIVLTSFMCFLSGWTMYVKAAASGTTKWLWP